MIVRAAVGQPWLLGGIAEGLATGRQPAPPPSAERADAACEHIESLIATMGAAKGVRHARKHLSAYALHAGADEHLRLRLVTSDSPAEIFRLLGEVFARVHARASADNTPALVAA